MEWSVGEMRMRDGCSLTIRLLLVLVLLVWPAVLVAEGFVDGDAASSVVTNDNRQPAGEMRDGSLRLALRAGLGSWRPEEDDAAALPVEAFGELAGPLRVPAPLIRVRKGTAIIASIRNDLPTPLQVHGLCARDGSPCPVLDVPPGETRDVSFTSGLPGTYYYWATTTGMPLAFRGSTDTQLSGALIVDSAEGAPVPDRVLRYHGVDQPDARAVSRGRLETRSRCRVSPSQAENIVRSQRASVAPYRAAHVRSR